MHSDDNMALPAGLAGEVYDKNRREIRRGDILKVFHFTGARNKRHYMYKQALGKMRYVTDPPYLKIGHIDFSNDFYSYPCVGQILPDYEIVQGLEAHWEQDRPRLAKAIEARSDKAENHDAQ